MIYARLETQRSGAGLEAKAPFNVYLLGSHMIVDTAASFQAVFASGCVLHSRACYAL